jgi:hypothetical protein
VNAAGSRPQLAALSVADSAGSWKGLGFAVSGRIVALGAVRIELGGTGSGITGWRLRGIEAVHEIDGLPTAVEDEPPPTEHGQHPNGAIGLDHVVVTTPEFDRTAQALQAARIPLRRERQGRGGIRQGFRRLGPAILELVQQTEVEPGPARFWGMVVTVSDLEALAERLGDRLGPIKSAVQPGRRIATLRSSAGLGEPVAFMSPEP